MKVYVIGAGADDLLKIRETLKLHKEAELVSVDSIENILIDDRVRSDVGIAEIHKLLPPPILPDLISYANDKRKSKGHERPYKFHK